MNTLVLGGTGFLGSHLCRKLIKAGHHVTVPCPKGKSTGNLNGILDQIKIISSSLEDISDHPEAWNEIDTVYHLACSSRPKSSNENPSRDISENLLATIRVLDRCVKEKVSNFIFSSSGGTVYGPPQKVPITEDHPTLPICSYGIHKLAIEHYLNLYHVIHGINYRVARIANAYGERQAVHGDQGLIAAVIKQLLEKKPVTIWGDGSAIRDYLHASDIASALVLLAECRSSERIFNIGSGTGLTVLQVIDAVEKTLEQRAKIIWYPARPLDVHSNVLDISRIHSHIGWQPHISLHDGITRTVRWFSLHKEPHQPIS